MAVLIDSRNWNIHALAWYVSLTRTFLFLFQVRIFYRRPDEKNIPRQRFPFRHETWYKVTRNLVSRTRQREWEVRNTSSCVRAGDLRGSVMQAASTGIGVALFNAQDRGTIREIVPIIADICAPRMRAIDSRTVSFLPPSISSRNGWNLLDE